jgi:hypothetical protein
MTADLDVASYAKQFSSSSGSWIAVNLGCPAGVPSTLPPPLRRQRGSMLTMRINILEVLEREFCEFVTNGIRGRRCLRLGQGSRRGPSARHEGVGVRRLNRAGEFARSSCRLTGLGEGPWHRRGKRVWFGFAGFTEGLARRRWLNPLELLRLTLCVVALRRGEPEHPAGLMSRTLAILVASGLSRFRALSLPDVDDVQQYCGDR